MIVLMTESVERSGWAALIDISQSFGHLAEWTIRSIY